MMTELEERPELAISLRFEDIHLACCRGVPLQREGSDGLFLSGAFSEAVTVDSY